MLRTKNLFYAMLSGLAFFVISCQTEVEQPLTDPSTVQATSEVIPGQYIVVYREGSMPDARRLFPGNYQQAQEYVREETRNLLSGSGLSSAEILNVYSQTVQGATLRMSRIALEKLRTDERVAYIEQDRLITMAPPWAGGGGGGSTGQTTPWGITRVNGGVNYSGSNLAWILDSGIDLDHPDLNVDASKGYNAFTTGRDSKTLDDGNGHGTHVAGTIAAINNAEGVIGVAAGATVIPVKVLDSRGSGSYSGVISGVDHVAANGKNGDVANMSLGGPPSQALDDAIKAAASRGIRFCLAAGNDSDDANNHSPARVNGTNIYTISAFDSKDVFASFSNYGNPPVDYSAPGVSINSTYKDGSYRSLSGTSMAAPHAAGILLLGNPSTDGVVKNDKDSNADAIIVR